MRSAQSTGESAIPHHASDRGGACTHLQKNALSKEKRLLLRDLGNIFGAMYILLAAIVGGAYLLLGEAFLQSPKFWGTVVLVSLIFSIFWLITRLDNYLREGEVAGY